MSVMVYKCPQCGAPLTFNADSQRWDCKFCLGSFDVDQVDRTKAEEVQDDGEQAEEQQPLETETTSGFSVDEEFNRSTKVFTCPDCGAQIVTDATTAATFCVFCHNPAIIESQLSGMYRPSKVIPFKFDKESAKKAFKDWCMKKPLVPAAFKAEPQLEKITGVYVPFWLFDSDVSGSVHANAQKIRKWRTGNYEYTETQYFEVYREGDMSFRGVPADGSLKMDDNMMDLLEPYDYSQMEDFSMPYLSGYLADKYDQDDKAVYPRIEKKVRDDTISQLMNTIYGYSAIQIINSDVFIRRNHVEYALLPVWMLTYKYKEKNYLFAMNGQTGKVVGNLPYSFGRAAAWFGGIAAAVFSILFLGGLVL
jgi:predicted RNA-binding Zn-ribbon protein involved in translation (DUF1610 family)